MKKRIPWDGILLFCCAAAGLCGAAGLLFFPAPRFSAAENRFLADTPAFSLSSFFSGEFSAAADVYMTERFPAREALRRASAALDLAQGKREAGGVILCTDGSLSRRTARNARVLAQNLASLRRFFENSACPATLAVAPRRLEARREVLPRAYDTAREQEDWAALAAAFPNAVMFGAITADTEWFRTDHHWTAIGAFAAYTALGSALGYEPYTLADFAFETVSTTFFGTSDAAAGIAGVSPDTIVLPRFAGDGAFRLTRDGAPAPFAGFYDEEKLRTRDGYAVFCGGNCGVLTADLGEDDARPLLLLVKDSFANALIPFLARHFRIVALDARYAGAAAAAWSERADAVLVLVGMQTLAGDAVLAVR